MRTEVVVEDEAESPGTQPAGTGLCVDGDQVDTAAQQTEPQTVAVALDVRQEDTELRGAVFYPSLYLLHEMFHLSSLVPPPETS